MKKNILLICIFGFLMFLTSCSIDDIVVDKRNCPINQLLLDQSDYPPDTIFDAIDSPIAEKPKESVGRSTYYLHGWMDEMVIRYSSANKAREVFIGEQKSIFHPSEVYNVWETPSTFDLLSLSANQYEIACGNVVSFGKRCYMIGQYEEYYVFFRADISNKAVTHELFRDLVLKIDDRMTSCLNQ